ncbi:MAG: ferredoxin-NADP reductase/fatty acid desaturase [Chitinophagales bacterium]|jgi:vanillate O-demethylase ferredoxin subunit
MGLTASNLKLREVINQVVNDPNYKKVSSVPLFSFHQIGIILFAFTGIFGGMALHVYANVSLCLVYPLMIFCFYAVFTPLHDATHRALSSNNFLNDLLGTISANLLFPFATTSTYRYLHLSHHRNVGDETWDPDDPLVVIPTKYFPFGYLVLMFPDILWFHWLVFKAWKKTPLRTRFSMAFMFIGIFIFNVAWFSSPYWYEYLILFFIPNRLGITYVAYSFAHIQHPEGLTWNEFPFKSTYKLKGNKFFMDSFLGQAHHAMHHMLPHVPWYKYHLAWDLANGAFREQGIPERTAFSKPDRLYKHKVIEEVAYQKDQKILLKVSEILDVATDVKSFIFEPANQEAVLPDFSAGSHIEVCLPSGLFRSYSLTNPSFDKNKFQIAVKLDPNSRGGSKEMHEKISVGDVLEISTPRNNFLLYENAKKYILISGGIGITPLLSMAHELCAMDKHFELHICSRNIEDVPFRFELENWSFAPNVELHLDNNGKSTIDLSKVLAQPDEESLVYVCGPTGFNKWVKETSINQGWSKEQIKQEIFSKDRTTLTEAQEFELVLGKSGKSITVKDDETIIDALHFNNVKVNYSCLQGTCGTCITPVLDGKIDHRDAVLSEEEKIENKLMCLCVSRAKGEKLTIDL